MGQLQLKEQVMSASISVYTVDSTASNDVELVKLPGQSSGTMDAVDDGGDDKSLGVKDLVVMYAAKSTIHGLPSTVGTAKYRGQRLFWLLLVVGMLAALVTVLTLQIQDYYSYPTVIDIHEEYLTVHDIPEITICKQETKVFRGSFDWNAGPGGSSSSFISLEKISGNYCLSGECILNFTKQREITRLTFASLDYVPLDYTSMTQVITDMGICKTFKTSEYIKRWIPMTNDTSNVPLDIMLAVNDEYLFTLGERKGLQLSLHLPGEQPFPRKNRVQIAINKSCRVSFNKVMRRSLTTPYVSFVGEQCVETHLPSFKNPLTRYSVYSKDTCLEECFVNFTIAQCGCRYYLHPGSEDMCDYSTVFCIVQARYAFRRQKRKCSCPPPCEYTQFESSVSCSEIKGPPFTLVHLEIVSDSDMKTEISQLPVYSIETILGTLGGLIGLFMGFSVVSIIEFLELICLALGCNLCACFTRRKP